MRMSSAAGEDIREGRQWPDGAARWRWVAGALVAAITVVMVVKFRHHDYKDAEVWYDAGRRVLSGETLAQLPHYRYPPAFAVLVAPLAALGPAPFFFLWYALNLVLFGASLWLAQTLAFPRDAGGRRASWVPTALVAVFALDTLFLGQTNILIMALVYWAFLDDLRGRQWRAGGPLGAAIAIKVFPVPLLAYFLYRRRYGVVVAGALWSAFFLFVLPAPVRGFHRNAVELRDWSDRVALPFVSHGKAGDWGQHSLDYGNQSLPAVARRFLTRVNVQVAAREARAIYVNVADLSSGAVNAVVLAVSSVLVLVLIYACGWSIPSGVEGWPARDRIQRAVGYSLATTLLLLTSALSWTYFFVMLLLPATVAVRLVTERDRVSALSVCMLRAALIALGAMTPLLMSQSARALGCLFWASLLLYATLALAAVDLRRAGAESVSEHPPMPAQD